MPVVDSSHQSCAQSLKKNNPTRNWTHSTTSKVELHEEGCSRSFEDQNSRFWRRSTGKSRLTLWKNPSSSLFLSCWHPNVVRKKNHSQKKSRKSTNNTIWIETITKMHQIKNLRKEIRFRWFYYCLFDGTTPNTASVTPSDNFAFKLFRNYFS